MAAFRRLAEWDAQAAPGGLFGGDLVSFLPMIAIFVVFYFLLIRPQQKKAKETRAMLSALQKGDEVVTAGGIVGRISKLGDQYATIEITDSVAMMGGHQVALARGYHGRLQNAVQSLESDVLNGLTRYHEMTAVLDKISAGELLARRQDMLSNQLLSHALEQMLARGKRLRDTEAATINMQLVTWRDARAVNEAFVAGTGDALRSWRQP